LTALEGEGLELGSLEITTCLRRGEIEIATRYEPDAQAQYEALVDGVVARHGEQLFSRDGATIDDQVATLLAAGHSVATAESCTAGMLAARLTERAGSSAYMLGGLIVYSDQAKVALAGVEAQLIERHGAVSEEVAIALAQGARTRLGAELGVGITGIAGPGGGTEAKPVGLVCVSVADGTHTMTRTVHLPGDRAAVRDRSATVALHMLRRVLLGE
jgi:nicotinamide-nucleotide amidase